MNEIVLCNSSMPVMGVCDLCAAPEPFFHADRTVDFHVLIYVIEGVVYVTEEGTDYEIHPGELLFLKSGIRHLGKREIPRGTRWYFIHFYLDEEEGIEPLALEAGPLIPNRPVRFGMKLPKKLTGLSGSEVESRISELSKLFHSENPMEKWEINARLFDFLGLAAFFGKQQLRPRTLSDRICGYLNEQLSEPFSARRMEQHFFLSYKHMAAMFKREKQMTLQQYHNKQRMAEACRLLRSTLLPVGEISKELGYSDMLYFSRCFHRYAGMSPTQYRRSAPSFY